MSLLGKALRKLNHHRTTAAYFVGYPKTGNTWARYMLGRYIQLICNLPYQPLFDATDALGRCERACIGPSMQFTHRPLVWSRQNAAALDFEKVIQPFRDKLVVLLIRHPLDTLVSLWMQRKHRDGSDYSGDIIEFLNDEVWGIEKFFRFYDLWYEHRGRVRDFYLLRYEEMRADPHSAFAALLKFLAIPRQDGLFEQAVAEADFESMKKVEASGAGPKYRSSGLDIFATGNRANPDAFHVRRGKVGGFRDYIDEDNTERLLELIDRRLPPFYGYANDSK